MAQNSTPRHIQHPLLLFERKNAPRAAARAALAFTPPCRLEPLRASFSSRAICGVLPYARAHQCTPKPTRHCCYLKVRFGVGVGVVRAREGKRAARGVVLRHARTPHFNAQLPSLVFVRPRVSSVLHLACPAASKKYAVFSVVRAARPAWRRRSGSTLCAHSCSTLPPRSCNHGCGPCDCRGGSGSHTCRVGVFARIPGIGAERDRCGNTATAAATPCCHSRRGRSHCSK